MKRFDEMNERELNEARASMTKEEIQAVMQKEEEELNRRMKAFGVEKLASNMEEETEEDVEKVSFNPETGEVIEVESTLLTREKEEKQDKKVTVSTGSITLVDLGDVIHFGFFDLLIMHKAVSQIRKSQREELDEMYKMLDGDRKFSKKNNDAIEKLWYELTQEARMLSNFAQACEMNATVVTRKDLEGYPVTRVNMKDEFDKLDEGLQYMIQHRMQLIANEFLSMV